jgi:hypothetical protein
VNFLILTAFLAAFNPDGAGTAVLPLLRVGQGPRAAALGEAYVSIADDASAIYWNPAGLGRIDATRLGVSHQQWFMDIKDEVANAALSTGTGAVGLGLVYSGDPGIETWSDDNMPGDTVRAWSAIVSAGYGTRVADRVWLGGSAKGLYENLHVLHGMGAAIDFGFVARPLPALSLGIVGRNIGTMLYGQDAEWLPVELALGASTSLSRFNATADVVLPFDNSANVRCGLEYMPMNGLAVRVGYRTAPADIGTLGIASGLTAGIGVLVGNFSVDYAFTPYGKLGTAHRIGLQARLPRKGTSALKLTVLDSATSLPLPANLAFTGISSGSAHTDDYGCFMLERLPPGALVVRANCDGYQPRVETVAVRREDRDQRAAITLQSVEVGSVWGALLDSATGKPLSGAIEWRGASGGTLAVDGRTGSFALKALPSGTYSFTASGAGNCYQPSVCTLTVEAGRLMQHDFVLAEMPRPLIFPAVFFAPAKLGIEDADDATLAAVARALDEHPSVLIEVVGHADGFEPTGSLGSLAALSQARADAVRRRLIDRHGVSPGRLVARGYAELRPLASSDTPDGQARNRSVEFITVRQ